MWGPVCRQWKVCWFKLDTIRIPLGSPVIFKAAMTIMNNGLHGPFVLLLDHFGHRR